MITVIIQGTKNIDRTLNSLRANAQGKFRVLVEGSIRQSYLDSQSSDIEFVRPGFLKKYGKPSDLYWVIPSGSLVLTAAWNTRLYLARRLEKNPYCLLPSGQDKYHATNHPRNIGKWKGGRYPVPVLRVTEV